MLYDIIIIGGGLIGCSIAYELSKYSLNIAVIESEYDVAVTAASSNSSIVYSGMENYDETNYELIKQGSEMMESLAKKFNVPYKKVGSVFLTSDENDMDLIDNIYEISKSNNLSDISLLNKEGMEDYSDVLKSPPIRGIHSLNTAIVKPYDLTLSYAEIAFDNGVEFKFEEYVHAINKVHKKYEIKTNKSIYTAKIIINTVKDLSFSWDSKDNNSKNGNSYYLYSNKNFKLGTDKVIFKFHKDNTRTYAYKTLQGNTKICIKSSEHMDTEQILNYSYSLLKNLKKEDIENLYTWDYYKNDLLINSDDLNKGYIKVAGRCYASITIAPALAVNITNMIINNLNCKLKKHYNDKRRDTFIIKNMTDEQINSLILEDPDFGKIICHCEKVSLGEIIDSIRRPLGARTIEGIKRRTGAALGNCGASYCLEKITKILSKETNKKFSEIIRESRGSFIVSGRIKEFKR